MDLLYPYLLAIHVICAIIFLGFIFTDVILLTPIRKKLGDSFADKMFKVIMQRSGKIMPFGLLLLILTGGAMISCYIGYKSAFSACDCAICYNFVAFSLHAKKT